MAENEPRAFTEEEVRAEFLVRVNMLVSYWAGEHPLSNVPEDYTILQRCEGVAFSILSTIDGSDLNLPAFSLTPLPAESDADYYRQRGENWYPSDIDIAGGLHDSLRHYRAQVH